MNYTSFLIEALNDLIQINEDRVTGFMHAVKGIDENDAYLKDVCVQIIKDGKTNINELSNQIKKIDIVSPKLDRRENKINDFWSEVIESDSSFRKYEQCFASCVCSEDAVQKVYEDTLSTYTFMTVELRLIITNQKKKINYAKTGIMSYLNFNLNNSTAVA